ncbi:Transcription factor bHLH68 [Bienertia sinuspersici]
MMGGNPSSWWSMHSNLRSSSSTSDHHHNHQQQQHEAEVVPTNLLISQTNPSNSLFSPLQFQHGHGGSSSSSSASSSSSSSSSSLLPFLTSADPHTQDFPHSWSQLLLGGLTNEQDQQERFNPTEFDTATRVINEGLQVDVKQEISHQSNNNNNNNLLQLYGNQFNEEHQDNQVSLGCNSTATTGGVPPKKPRVQPSSTPPLKTDTASVLLEAIGYIRFLQGQIEALSSPLHK